MFDHFFWYERSFLHSMSTSHSLTWVSFAGNLQVDENPRQSLRANGTMYLVSKLQKAPN